MSVGMQDANIEVERHTVSAPLVEVKNPVPLKPVVRAIRRRFGRRLPRGYLGGKRRMQRALRDKWGVTPSRAAYLVDRLEESGKIVYEKSAKRARWHIRS
ncbi:MAG: hypothetical protein AB8I08_31890 [Sandaracinaceae bacterium]